MSTEGNRNKRIVRRLFDDVWNRGDLEATRAILAHPEGVQHYVAEFRAAFPDVYHEVLQLIVEGDTVAGAWSARATHTGDWLGLAASGRKVAWTGVTIARIRNGLIVEHNTHWDRLGLALQLGTIPVGAWLPIRR